MRRYVFAILSILFSVTNAFAIETIEVNKGRVDPSPIAINLFKHADNPQAEGLARDIRSVIESDLESSGLFRSIHPSAFIDDIRGVDRPPLFAAWRQIRANHVVNVEIKVLNKNKFEISFVLWNSYTEKDMTEGGEVMEVPAALWRRAAHKVADKVYQRITGEKGYFDTRIAYISEYGGYKDRTRRLAVVDHDGANHAYLTDGRNMVLTPRFSPKGNKLLYLFKGPKDVLRVHLRDLNTGKDIVLGHFPGMTSAPRFSPDGTKVLMAISMKGATNIIEMDLATKQVKALTKNNAINTSASYSPDGKYIAFNSDRGGSRQLYVMDSDGSNVRRLSFGNGGYATPVWSPRGDLIAFTKLIRGEGFHIGVIKPDGSGERLIAHGYLVEGPSWTPNGRMIIFTKEDAPTRGHLGSSRLHVVDITGNTEYMIKTPKDASDPEWSGLLD